MASVQVLDSTGSTFNRGDFTATGAFFWSSINLAPYGGQTRYSIVLTDGAAKTATGFIGAVGAGGAGPAGESLDTELSPNPGFEGTYVSGVAPNWEVSRGTKSEYTLLPHGGVSAQQIDNPAGNNAYLNQVVAGTINRLYCFSAWFKALGGAGNWKLELPADTPLSADLTDVGWMQKIIYGTCSATTTMYFNLYAKLNATAGVNSVVWDDASVKRVLDPPSTSVHIVSAYGGSVRAWASIDSGFNPNTIASWVINENRPTGSIFL